MEPTNFLFWTKIALVICEDPRRSSPCCNIPGVWRVDLHGQDFCQEETLKKLPTPQSSQDTFRQFPQLHGSTSKFKSPEFSKKSHLFFRNHQIFRNPPHLCMINEQELRQLWKPGNKVYPPERFTTAMWYWTPGLLESKSLPMKPNLENAAITQASPVSFLSRSPSTQKRIGVERGLMSATTKKLVTRVSDVSAK